MGRCGWWGKDQWQWWVISPNSRKLGFGGVPLELLHKTMELGSAPRFFLEEIHGGAAGAGCVWLRKFGAVLFFIWSCVELCQTRPYSDNGLFL
jgi:hypothetical protein